MKNFEARNGNYETSAVVKNQRVKQREQRTPGDCWQWKAKRQCSKGESCSFRHDMNKRAKSTQPNPSPGSSMQQSVREVQREPEVLEERSPSGKMARLPCKDYLKGTCTTPFCEKLASSRMLVLQVRKWMHFFLNALMRIARLMNSLAKGLKRMVTKVQWLCLKLRANWVAYLKIWSRRILHRSCGRAQTY